MFLKPQTSCLSFLKRLQWKSRPWHSKPCNKSTGNRLTLFPSQPSVLASQHTNHTMKITRQQSVRIFVASLSFRCYFENFSHVSQKTLGHANIGLSKLILENEHKAGLFNFVTGINLFALQLMIQFVHSFWKKV